MVWLAPVFGCWLTVEGARVASAEPARLPSMWSLIIYRLSQADSHNGRLPRVNTVKVSYGLSTEAAYHYFSHSQLDKTIVVGVGGSYEIARERPWFREHLPFGHIEHCIDYDTTGS